MLPKLIPGNSVICLFEVNESHMQPWGGVGLLFLSCMDQVSQNEHGLQCVPARIKNKLRVCDFVLSLALFSCKHTEHICIEAIHSATNSQHAVVTNFKDMALLMQGSDLQAA
eukprot:1083020-Pelagomonas_calceolata.AAC.2